MKAVIMAAGKGERMSPLSITTPKPLLKIANKTLLHHTLDTIAEFVDEVILIVGYKKDMMQEHIEDYKKNLHLKITLVEQKEQLGTGHALLQAKDLVSGKFLLLGGDDFFAKEDIKECLENDLAILLQQSETPEQFGTVLTNDCCVVEIMEKHPEPQTNLVNTGCYVLDEKIFDLLSKVEKSKRGEIELTDALNTLANGAKIKTITTDKWVALTHPWDLLGANEILLNGLVEDKCAECVKGKVEKGATIKGPVIIGEGTVVKAGAYIEGPVIIGEGCDIGPNCYIRPCTTIGNRCKVGNAVEVKNSILFDDAKVGHLSYIGDSVLGFGCNMGASTITANLKHNNQNVWTTVKSELINTGRRKFGTIIGDNVHTGIHTSIYPGRKLWPDTMTLPGEVLNKDKTS